MIVVEDLRFLQQSFQPSIHFLYIHYNETSGSHVQGQACDPACLRSKAGSHRVKWPFTLTVIPTVNLEFPTNPACMSLACGNKPEPSRHRENMQTPQRKMPGLESNPQPTCCEVAALTDIRYSCSNSPSSTWAVGIYLRTESGPVLLLLSFRLLSSGIISPHADWVRSLLPAQQRAIAAEWDAAPYVLSYIFQPRQRRRGAAHHKRPFKKSSSSLFITRLFWEMYSQSAPAPPFTPSLSWAQSGHAFQWTTEDDGRINNWHPAWRGTNKLRFEPSGRSGGLRGSGFLQGE